MAERSFKPEIASQKRVVKFPAAIGDWTTYRPPKVLVKKVKSGLYGFDRLSKKELNQALLIHYHFIQDLFKRLKIDLGIGIEFLSVQVEQTTYLNFLRTLNGPVAQGKLSIPNIHESVQLFFDLNIANSIINHALGSRDLEPMNRGLTEPENSVFSTAVAEYLPLYTSAFEGAIGKPAFNLVGSPDVALDPSINTSATFVIFSAEACLNDNPPGKITFGYPGSTIKKILSQYSAKNAAKPLDFSLLPTATLSKIKALVIAQLGKTTLSNSDLHQLEVGDVVSLDTLINSPVVLTIGNFLKLFAQPGIKNRKKAVRIAGLKEDESLTITPPLKISEEVLEEKEPPEKEEDLPEEENEEEGIEEEAEEETEEEDFPEEKEEETEEEAEEETEEEDFPAEEEELLDEEEIAEEEEEEFTENEEDADKEEEEKEEK